MMDNLSHFEFLTVAGALVSNSKPTTTSSAQECMLLRQITLSSKQM
jgi:hypothetical protein